MLVEQGTGRPRGRPAQGRRPVRLRPGWRGGRGAGRGRRAVRGRPRHHERDRRTRVRRHPGHPPGPFHPLHGGHRQRGPDQGHAPTSTGRRWPAPAARSSSSWVRPGSRGIARAPDRGRARARHPGRRGAQRHATRPGHRAGHARDDRRRRRRGAVGGRGRRGGRARPRLVRAAPAVRPDDRGHPGSGAGERAADPTRRTSAPTVRGAAVDRDRGGRLRPARPLGLRLDRLHVGQRCARVLRPRARRRPASTPGPSAACGSPRSGPGPRRRSADRGIRVDLLPERFVAESLLDAFPDPDGCRASGCCSPAPSTRATCSPMDSAPGATRSTCSRCTGRSPRRPIPTRSRSCATARVDAVTFTSSSTVRNFVDLVGPLPEPDATGGVDRSGHLRHRPRARPHRRPPKPTEHTIDGLVATLLTLLGRSSSA